MLCIDKKHHLKFKIGSWIFLYFYFINKMASKAKNLTSKHFCLNRLS